MANVYFGCIEQDVTNLFPSGLETCDVGGSVVIAQIIKLYYNKLIAQLAPIVFETLIRPDRQQIVRYSQTGVSTATVGLFPIKPGSQVRCFTDPNFYDDDYQYSQLTTTIVNALTGEISFQSVAPTIDVWASYETDFDQLVIPSLADIIKYGVAAQLILANIPKDQDGYATGLMYQSIWNDEIEKLAQNKYGIPELRKLIFWESSTDSPGIISLRKRQDA